MKTKYIFIGGAYGDDYWSSYEEPDKDTMEFWSTGELIILKIDCDMNVFQPDGKGNWEPIKQR